MRDEVSRYNNDSQFQVCHEKKSGSVGQLLVTPILPATGHYTSAPYSVQVHSSSSNRLMQINPPIICPLFSVFPEKTCGIPNKCCYTHESSQKVILVIFPPTDNEYIRSKFGSSREEQANKHSKGVRLRKRANTAGRTKRHLSERPDRVSHQKLSLS